jgi:hypothetical protein
MFLRMLRLAAAALLVATATLGVVAAPASAATGNCPGSQIDRDVANVASGTPIVELRLYYDGSTGKNCVRVNHVGPSYGHAAYTSAILEICAETTPGPVCTYTQRVVDAKDTFEYYAGPVSAVGRNHCIHAYGALIWGGNTYWVNTINSTGTVASHCR